MSLWPITSWGHWLYVCVHWLYVCVHWLYVCVHWLYVCVHWLYVCVHWLYCMCANIKSYLHFLHQFLMGTIRVCICVSRSAGLSTVGLYRHHSQLCADSTAAPAVSQPEHQRSGPHLCQPTLTGVKSKWLTSMYSKTPFICAPFSSAARNDRIFSRLSSGT